MQEREGKALCLKNVCSHLLNNIQVLPQLLILQDLCHKDFQRQIV